MIHILDLFGVAVFAVTGRLAQKGEAGILVLTAVTGILLMFPARPGYAGGENFLRNGTVAAFVSRVRDDAAAEAQAVADSQAVTVRAPWIDAGAYGSSLTGKTIQSAIDAISSANRTLLLAPGTWTISSDVTVPSNVNLRFEQGAIVSIKAGAVFAIDGPIEAGLYHIFDGSGSVSFGSGHIEKIYPQWWGARGDGVTDDHSAIQRCINSLPTGGVVKFPIGKYMVSDTLTFRGPDFRFIRLEGEYQGWAGREDIRCSMIKSSFKGKTMLDVNGARNIHIEKLNLRGPGAADANSVGILIRGGSDIVVVRDVNITYFENCVVIGVGQAGNSRNFFYNVFMDKATRCMKSVSSQAYITNLYGCSFGTDTRYGFEAVGTPGYTGNVLQIFGGEFGSWDVIFRFMNYGTAYISGAHFEPTKAESTTFIAADGVGHSAERPITVVGCQFSINYKYNKTKPFIIVGGQGPFLFMGNYVAMGNPIIALHASPFHEEHIHGSKMFMNNCWEYAPHFRDIAGQGYPRVLIQNETYKRTNIKSAGYNRIWQCWPTTTYSYNGIRTEYFHKIPAFGYWRKGSKVWNTDVSAKGTPGWICTRTGKLGTTTGSMVAGTNTLTVADNKTWELNDGIVVAGAGRGGGNLISKVTGISGTTFTLDKKAETTVESAKVSHNPEAAFQAMPALGP